MKRILPILTVLLALSLIFIPSAMADRFAGFPFAPAKDVQVTDQDLISALSALDNGQHACVENPVLHADENGLRVTCGDVSVVDTAPDLSAEGMAPRSFVCGPNELSAILSAATGQELTPADLLIGRV